MPLLRYLIVLAVVLVTTLLLFALRTELGDANISLLYLLIVLFCATTAGARLTIFCGVISFFCYDFFLVPPQYAFITNTPVKLLDPLAFLVVALVAGTLSERSRKNAIEKIGYQQASQFRASILHLVSHNLRTPIATIKTALTSVIATEELDLPQHDLLNVANQECDRLNRLIENVLQISRLDADAIQLRSDWNGLDEVVSSAFSRWRDAIANKQLTASIPAMLPLIRFDFALIESVLTNLIENAFRHGKTPVHVSIKLETDEVLVTVEDHGSGVAVQDRGALFKQFSTSKSSGLGLGLAVCKGLIEAHQGQLWAEFSPQATRFIFSLPLITYQEVTHASSTDS